MTREQLIELILEETFKGFDLDTEEGIAAWKKYRAEKKANKSQKEKDAEAEWARRDRGAEHRRKKEKELDRMMKHRPKDY